MYWFQSSSSVSYNSTSFQFELDKNVAPDELNRTVDLLFVDHSSKDVIELIGMDASEKLLGLWIPLVWRNNPENYVSRNMSILCLQNQSCQPLKSMNATNAKYCIYKRTFIPYSDVHKDICGSQFSIPGGNANVFYPYNMVIHIYMIRIFHINHMIWFIWYEMGHKSWNDPWYILK